MSTDIRGHEALHHHRGNVRLFLIAKKRKKKPSKIFCTQSSSLRRRPLALQGHSSVSSDNVRHATGTRRDKNETVNNRKLNHSTHSLSAHQVKIENCICRNMRDGGVREKIKYWGGGVGVEGGRNDLVRVCVGVGCLLYTSPSPRDRHASRMPSSA